MGLSFSGGGGGGGGRTNLDYMQVKLSGDTGTLTVGTAVGFDTIIKEDNTNSKIVLIAGGRVTLQPGNYKLTGAIQSGNASLDLVDYRLFDVTNAVFVGNSGSSNITNATGATQPIAEAFVEITVPTTYELRISFVLNTPIAFATASFLEVEERHTVAGTPLSTSTTLDYMHLKLNSDTGTLSTNDRIPFDIIIKQDNSNSKIVLNAGGTFTLQPGNYGMSGAVRGGNTANDVADYSFFDVTNSVFIGNISNSSVHASTFNFSSQQISEARVEITVATTYEFRVSGIINTPIAFANGTFTLIEERGVGTTGGVNSINGQTGNVTLATGGDVVGPVSATNENLPVFDGVTGKLIKDSGISINDIDEDKVNSGNGTIVSAATTNIGAEQENRLDVTGTTTITAFGTIVAGIKRTLIFSEILILTHNGTSLILPTASNIATAAGDVLTAISLGSGNWKVTNYQREDGTALVGGTGGGIHLNWQFDTTTTAADPGLNKFRMNNATPASVTELYIDDIANSGTDAGTVLNALSAGDKIYIQQLDTPANNILLTVVSVTDNTGFFTIVVTVDDSGTLFSNTENCGFDLFFSTGDVVGPASSTTNNISTFADATGKLLKDSGVGISDILTGANGSTVFLSAITPLTAPAGGSITEADLTLSGTSDAADQTLSIGPGGTKPIVPAQARWVLCTTVMNITATTLTNFFVKHANGTAITSATQTFGSSIQEVSEQFWAYIGPSHILKYRTTTGANISSLQIFINGWATEKDDSNRQGVTIMWQEPLPTGDIVNADLTLAGAGATGPFTLAIGPDGKDIVPKEARWVLIEGELNPSGTAQATFQPAMRNNQVEVVHIQNPKGIDIPGREAAWVFIGADQLFTYRVFNGAGITTVVVNIIGWSDAGDPVQTDNASITELLPPAGRDIVKADLTLNDAFQEITIGPGDTKNLVPEEARWALMNALVNTVSTSTTVALAAYHIGTDNLAGRAQTTQNLAEFTEESFWVYIGPNHTVRYKSTNGASIGATADWWVIGWAPEGGGTDAVVNTSATLDFLHAKMASDTATLAANDKVVVDTLVDEDTTNGRISNVSGTFTIQPGSYKLSGRISGGNDLNDSIDCRFFDVTNSVFIGTTAVSAPAVNVTNTADSQQEAIAFVDITVETVYEFRVETIAGDPILFDSGTDVDIVQRGAVNNSGNSTTLDYLQAELSTGTGDLVFNNTIDFDTIISQDTTNAKIALNAGGSFTLQPGNYKMSAGVRGGNASGDRGDFEFFDVTNVASIGNISSTEPSPTSTDSQHRSVALVEITVATTYRLRVAAVAATPTLVTNGTYLLIEERGVGTTSGGNVSGPGTAVDGNIPIFNGTTGKLLKDSTTTQIRTLLNVEDNADVTDETNVKSSLDGATIPTATVASDDKILGQDTDDADNLKTFIAQDIADLAPGVAPAASSWMLVDASKYTALPASTSQVSMSDTSDLKVKMPVRYVTSAGTFFGEVASIVTDTSFNIRGAAFVIGGGENITELSVGQSGLRQVVTFFVAGTWANGVDANLLVNDMKMPLIWDGDDAYCIGFRASQHSVDTGTEGKFNIEVNDLGVSTNDTNNGIQLGLVDADTVNPDIAINKTNYKITAGDLIEGSATAAGSSGDGEDLTVTAIFIFEGKDTTKASSDWQEIDVSKYTTTPDSTSQILMSDTGDLKLKMPIRYVTSAGTFFGEVASIVSNTSFTIRGAAFVVAELLTELSIGNPGLRQDISLFVSLTWANGIDTDLLANDMKSPFIWDGDTAYCIGFRASQHTVDAGTEGKLNLEIDNSKVSTNDTNNGIQLGLVDVDVANPDIAINKTNYKIFNGNLLEANCTVAGGTGDAEDLTITAIIILEGK